MAEEEEIVLKEIEFFGDSFVFQDPNRQKIEQEEEKEEGEIVEDSDENQETSRKRPHPVGPKEDDQIQEEEKKKKRLENTPEGEVPDDDPIPEDPFQNPPEDSKDEIPEDPIQESC
ncbi:hypothetical protein L5515_012715 [Caenorhabditis briggsae]|uniref:Uncharacterized protein n=1 Tax=Caenorhabditis briggsae TaxID=6238 RepID=A0AAE9JHH0_CAEBR|nr:hypothetical protein L5515_012715 [Caenorhabditis briggsae]